MNEAALKAKLNLRLNDTDNFTFTDEEKTEVLDEAIHDDLVVSPVWDSSLTFQTSTYQYTVPVTMTTIQDIYIRTSNSTDTEPETISSRLWEVVDGKLQFKNNAGDVIPQGYTLYLKGNYKYTTTDTISEINVQEYVLNLAQLNCLNMLGVKKALKFLKNDTSMSEIIAVKRELERKVGQYKQRLPRSFEGA